MKKCFTINPLRTTEDFESYNRLLENNIYQGIEIFYPYKLEAVKFRIYEENVMKLLEKFPKTEVVLHLPHGPENDLCDFENSNTVIPRMKAAIKFASQFKAKKLTLHLGYAKKDIERENYIHYAVKVVKELCSYADCFKMNIMIENMPGIGDVGYSPEEILNIINRVNLPNLKFIFDTGHAHVSEFEDTSYLFTLADYLYHIHYNDNNGKRDEHKRIGLGTIDFNAHFKALKAIDYQELHCMEVIFNSAEDLENYANDLNNDILK